MSKQDEQLLAENIGLVKSIALHYKHSNLALEDLVQEGMLGLLQAISHYQENKGTKFSTYATYWIKKYILLAVERENRHSWHETHLSDEIEAGLSEKQLPPATKIQPKTLDLPASFPLEEKQVLTLSFEQGKTISEIAHDLGITNEKVRQIRQKALRRLRSGNGTLLKGKI